MRVCHDPEGWTPASALRPFDLTPCFEEGAILSPILLLLAASAVYATYHFSVLPDRERSLKSVWLLRAKLAVLGCALGVSLAGSLYLNFKSEQRASFAVPLWTFLEPLGLAVAIPLTALNHGRARTSSSILLAFWPPYVLALAIWTRTMLAEKPRLFLPLIFKDAVGILGLLSLCLECVTPEIGSEMKTLDGEGIKESPVETANLYSVWSFSWMTPLLKRGASQFITEEDLPPLPSKDESAKLSDRFENALQKRKSLWAALLAAYGGQYAVAATLKILQDMLAFLQPQLLRLLLSFVSTYQAARESENGDSPSDARPSPVQGFAIAGTMFVAALTQTILLHQYFQRCFETGMRVRAGLVNKIYKKALVLSSTERGRSTGDITNLMSVDATRLQDFCTYGLVAVSGPFQITLAFVSLYSILGWPAFVGVAIMIVSVPLNATVARALKKMQEKQMKNRDRRTKMMSELLNNIKSIKLYAWENAFSRRILDVRNNQELKMLKKISVAMSLNMSLWTGIPLLVAFSSFAVAGLVSTTALTSDVIFPSISLFMLLQFPLAMFAQVTSNIIEAVVSIRRLQSYLDASELQSDARTNIADAPSKAGDIVLEIKRGEFRWSDESAPTLEDINLTIRKGELVGIMGRVGAGKSSLLAAVIGDMKREDGEVVVHGSIAYAPQNPWIMSATIRENIVFSHEFDEAFYNLVIDACALRQDLALLPHGDLTEVGEKGITLSGGQKARVSLARAVYARADLVILDDVLAAVDSHVARHVFDRVIGPRGLLSRKARIHVTNSIAFLNSHDYLVYIRRGIILEAGTFESLLADKSSQTSRLIVGHGTSLSSSGSATPRDSDTFVTEDAKTVIETSADLYVGETKELEEKHDMKDDYPKSIVVGQSVKKLTGDKKEHSEQGGVKKDVYAQYVKAASRTGFAMFILSAVLQQAASVLGNVVLRAWGEHNRESGSNTYMGKYLLAYGVSSLGSTLFGATSAIILWLLVSIRTARHLHDSMLHAVLLAPLSFFELTPTGRIMNLFSRDVYVVDQVLPSVIGSLVRTICVCVGIVAVIGTSFPLFLLAVIPLAWFYRRVMIYYLATSRELKRLDAVSRSPIFAWFSETLGGLSTIRAFSQQWVFIRQNESLIDRNQTCYLPSISINRWLAVRLELVGAVIILAASTLALVALITTGVDAGLVGLVLSYGLNTTSSLNWVVRSASEVEQNIVSVERILHYVRLGPEAPHELPGGKKIPEWPTNGGIEFRDYSMRYRKELDLSLKNISVQIQAGEKIGICGRTGSGKSSLLLALFRIIEPASGTIVIDGVDITSVGLHDLRSSISIVPQSPDLFEGTIRENIDPTGEYQDIDIWITLDQVHLKDYIESLDCGLDTTVQEGGYSLSQGQRQLICFARALLRKTKVLVLDEATSAVDLDTDRAIQEVIRGPQFKSVTMLIIAHRLNTIMDCDRVLVLDGGQVRELDAPQSLLAKKESNFRSLAAEAGLV